MRLLIVLALTIWSTFLGAQFYLDLSAQECYDLIEEYEGNPKFTILDVRTPAEYIPEHISGAFNRNFYDVDFKEQLDSLDKSRVYMIYCRSGSRSGQTLDIVEELAFDTVFNMIGGITQWNQDGYPVTDVIPEYIDIYATSSSTAETEDNDFEIYPNPTTGIVNLHSELGADVNIYDQSGSLVTTGYSVTKVNALDISALPKGLYFISTQIDKKQVVKKIMKL